MAHDPDFDARRAVAVTRVFLPLYAGATAMLLLPAVLRLGGATVPAASLASTLTLVVMAVSAPAYLAWLARLGQYRAQGGLQFRLGPALLRGEHVPLHGPAASPMPTGWEADARRIADDLRTAGAADVADAMTDTLAEADRTRRAPRTPGDTRADRAIARLRDTVARHADAANVELPALHATLETHAAELRAARLPPADPVGS